MNHPSVLLLSITAALLFAGDVQSQAYDRFEPLMVSKEADGKLNNESRQSIRRLNKLARRNGETAVWVTLSSTYLAPYVGQLSEEELEEQDRMARQRLIRILDPLVQSGNARHSADGPIIRGPSCLVMVDEKALRKLVRDHRVSQIVGRIVRLETDS